MTIRGGNRLRNGFVLVLCLVICGCSTAQTSSTLQQSGPAQSQENLVSQPPAKVLSPSGAVSVPYIPPPNSIDLCGEPVPLDRQDVYERFDKEFTLVVYNHAQVYLWLKRMERYFPMIEERLRYFNLPDDLKYVAIAESDLLPNVCSPKGAAGPWQFMPGTGAAYGLKQRGSVDKRYDFECSTDGAFLLLKDLYQKYHSWSLAIAAYNCGDKRIFEQSRIQGVSSYYDMKLPQETERYVIRIIAIKEVLSNPSRYGYDLPNGWGYGELRFDRVNVSLSGPVSIQTIAACAGTTYREIRRFNPMFRSDDIPAGDYEIKLPMGTGNAFKQNFFAGSSTSSGTSDTGYVEDSQVPEAPTVTHTSVRSGSVTPASPAKVSVSKQKTRSAKASKGKNKTKTAKAPRGKHKIDSKKAGSRDARQKARLAKAGAIRSKHDKSTKAGAQKEKKKRQSKD